jgi:hypothetical protein
MIGPPLLPTVQVNGALFFTIQRRLNLAEPLAQLLRLGQRVLLAHVRVDITGIDFVQFHLVARLDDEPPGVIHDSPRSWLFASLWRMEDEGRVKGGERAARR